MKLGNFTSFFTDKRDGPHFKRKKNRDFIRLYVCLLISTVSAFLLVPSKSDYYLLCHSYSFSADFYGIMVTVVVFSSFLIIRYHESANDQVYDKEKSMILIPLLHYMERYCIQLV